MEAIKVPYILPSPDKRTAIVGSTGSGKTFLAVWLLSSRDFHRRPWFIVDFKGDKLIASLGAKEISVYSPPPTQAGLYVIRPIKNLDDEALERFLWKIWSNENAGVYTDEGFMIDARSPSLLALLTQGRSKNIEMITLVQRPRWCCKFIFSEANHFYVMKLTMEEDRKYISSYLDGTSSDRLPRFHSLWYNADEQQSLYLKPVPDRKELISIFSRRLANERKVKAL